MSGRQVKHGSSSAVTAQPQGDSKQQHDQGIDECLFTETDEQFWVGLNTSSSGHFLFVRVKSSITSEVWYIDLKQQSDGALPVRRRLHAAMSSALNYILAVGLCRSCTWLSRASMTCCTALVGLRVPNPPM